MMGRSEFVTIRNMTISLKQNSLAIYERYRVIRIYPALTDNLKLGILQTINKEMRAN